MGIEKMILKHKQHRIGTTKHNIEILNPDKEGKLIIRKIKRIEEIKRRFDSCTNLAIWFGHK